MIPQLTTYRSIDSAILQGEASSVSLADSRRAAALGYLNRICWSRLLSRKEVARKQGFEVYESGRRKRSNGDLRREVGRIRDDLVGGQQDIAGSALS